MAEPPKNTEQLSDTGEFVTDEFDRAMLANQPVRRRRRRKKPTSKGPGKVARTVGVALFCAMLIIVGVFLGLSYQADDLDAERYRIALQARQKVREQWLTECNDKGHSDWTCNKFDRTHFATAELLDEFRCDNLQDKIYHCQYTLGKAKVVVAIPTAIRANGEYRAPISRAHAIISHSDQNEHNYVTVSEKGLIEIRSQNHDEALIVINPSTGTMDASDAITGSDDQKSAVEVDDPDPTIENSDPDSLAEGDGPEAIAKADDPDPGIENDDAVSLAEDDGPESPANVDDADPTIDNEDPDPVIEDDEQVSE